MGSVKVYRSFDVLLYSHLKTKSLTFKLLQKRVGLNCLVEKCNEACKVHVPIMDE